MIQSQWMMKTRVSYCEVQQYGWALCLDGHCSNRTCMLTFFSLKSQCFAIMNHPVVVNGASLRVLCMFLQNPKGLAEEEVRRQVWMPDYFPQHGEDKIVKLHTSRAKLWPGSILLTKSCSISDQSAASKAEPADLPGSTRPRGQEDLWPGHS